MPSINRVNFIIVHIFNQAVLERSNYRVTQKERDPNFKPEYLVAQGGLSIGFISIEISFLCLSVELFWNNLIAYAKEKIFFLEPCENGLLFILENLKNYMIQLKHFCNASDWSNDDFEAMQVRAERLLGFMIQIQAQYPNVNGIDDLEETVRVILNKVVQETSQETQSSSTPVVVCNSEGKDAPEYQISYQQFEFYVANGFTVKLIPEMLQVSFRTVKRR